MSEPFYWRNARDSLITRRALQLFQILAKHEGEEFDAAKDDIDREYLTATGETEIARHGGKIQTAKEVYREAGWVDLSPNATGQSVIRITDAGRQALMLLTKLPDFLKAAPHFVVELRYFVHVAAVTDASEGCGPDSTVSQCLSSRLVSRALHALRYAVRQSRRRSSYRGASDW
jgi:hypothetical protein